MAHARGPRRLRLPHPHSAMGVIAIVIAALMLSPAEMWRSPETDALYAGFDPNLIYGVGNDPSLAWLDLPQYREFEGQVTISRDMLKLTALRLSRPTVHLVTSPISFRVEFDASVLSAGMRSTPLRVGIWTPRGNHGFFINFAGPPGYALSVLTMVSGSLSERRLGRYVPGCRYRVSIDRDGPAGVIRFTIRSNDASPVAGGMLRITSGVSRGTPIVWSDRVAVEKGKGYLFGGAVKGLVPSGVYGFILEWFDTSGKRVGLTSEWAHAHVFRGWTVTEHQDSAPMTASSARLGIGAGEGADVVYAGPFFRRYNEPSVNLLRNQNFTKGTRHWRAEGTDGGSIIVLNPPLVEHEASITREQFSELFRELRLSLTVSAEAAGEPSTATLENYLLSLPHQRYLAAKTADTRQRSLTIGLLVVTVLVLSTVYTGRNRR